MKDQMCACFGSVLGRSADCPRLQIVVEFRARCLMFSVAKVSCTVLFKVQRNELSISLAYNSLMPGKR